LYDGADADGGADLISELVVFVVVEELVDPDSYVVVASELYPPSIAVLEPLVFVCVDPECAGVANKVNKTNSIINIPVK